MNTESQLILASATLARNVPQEWEAFLTALADRVVEANNALISSELVTLQINQGRAQAYGAIYRTLRDCIKKQEELQRGKIV